MSELIKVKTRDFDMIEIPENEILHFTQGIYAFDDYFRYVLLAPMGKNKFPMWLQCIDNENLCFIIFDPLECCTDYSVTLSDDEKELGIPNMFFSEENILEKVRCVKEKIGL